LKVICQSGPFLWFTLFGVVWGIASNSFGPFYVIFMYKHLNLSSTDISILVVIMSVCSSLSLPAWGRLLDRYGNKSVMLISLLVWQVQNYLWYYITPATAWALYLMFLLGLFNLLLKLAPSGARTMAIAVNLALTSLFMAIGVILGGKLLSSLSAFDGASDLTYHLAFLFQPTVALFGCLVLLQVDEPKTSSLKHVVIDLLTLRTMSGLIGLTSFYGFAQYFSLRKTPKQE